MAARIAWPLTVQAVTAVDTNVIVALLSEHDALNHLAQKALQAAQERGRLVICAAVHAELLAMPGRDDDFVDRFCADTAIAIEWDLSEKAWRLAGKAFRSYSSRRQKGKAAEPRRILADFLIGAHAMSRGYRLLTLDDRLYRAAFSGLVINSF